MPRKMIIYKTMLDERTKKIFRSPLRQVTVHDSFVGISKYGESIQSEFMKLAQDLEGGNLGLVLDILTV